VLYADFTAFTRDQEKLIFAEKAFDYVEGFVIINRTGLLNNWRSSFNPQDPVQASKFKSDGRTLFCLELAKYYNLEETLVVNQVKLLILQFLKNTLHRNKYSTISLTVLCFFCRKLRNICPT